MKDYANFSELDLMREAHESGLLAFRHARTRFGFNPSNPFRDPLNRWAWDLGWRCAQHAALQEAA